MKKRIHPRRGRLTVVAGPMFSGKTSKLVAMVEVFSRMRHKVLTIKPKLDDRYGGKEEIHSHDHKKTPAIVVDHEKPEEVISKNLADDADDVIFDEAQFFNKTKLMRVIETLRNRGVHVIAAGLLYDYRRKPFGAMPDLLGVADEQLELFAICQRCGRLARHLERIGGGKGLIEVGGAEKYIAVCEKCHRIYK